MKYKILIFCLFFPEIFGCAQMRDYVGAGHGVVSVGMKQKFGEGQQNKDYYIIDDYGNAVVVGDSKDDVFRKIGSPDNTQVFFDGDESWIYKEKELKLIFNKGRLKKLITLARAAK